MTLFDHYHDLAAQLMGREDFPLPLPNWDRDYPHNIGLLSDAEESELAAIVLQLTRGMSYESWKALDMAQRVPWMQQAVTKLPPGGGPGRMSKADVLAELASRVQNGTPIITADEVARWPAGMVDEFESTGILRVTDHAKSVACDSCGQDHVEQVQYIQSPPGSELRAYIDCLEIGRVQIPLHRLRQWVIDPARLPAGSKDAMSVSEDVQESATNGQLQFDRDTFTVRFDGRSCELRNTKEYHLLVRLSRRPGIFVSNSVLASDVWDDEHTEKSTIQKTVSNLRRSLKDAGIKNLVLDGTTNKDHYALKLP